MHQQPKPKKRSGYHHGDLKKAIIYAAAQLIAQRKSTNFHLKDVAALVGRSQPALYKHFESKEEMLIEAAVTAYKLQSNLREHSVQNAGQCSLSRVLALSEAYIYFSISYPGFFLLIKNMETADFLASARYVDERDKTLSQVKALVQQCLDDGLFRALDIETAMSLLQASVFGFSHLYITEQINITAPTRSKDPGYPLTLIKEGLSALLSTLGSEKLAQLHYQPTNFEQFRADN